jgi:hypothetical protein
MVDVISGLIWLAVIAAFVTPWVKTFIQQRQVPRGGRPPGGPRSLSQSGGYEPVQPSPPQRAGSFQSGRNTRESDSVEELTPIRRLPKEIGAPVSSSTTSVPARQIRRALATPDSVRQAFLLKEVLEKPLAMRDSPQSPNGQAQ